MRNKNFYFSYIGISRASPQWGLVRYFGDQLSSKHRYMGNKNSYQALKEQSGFKFEGWDWVIWLPLVASESDWLCKSVLFWKSSFGPFLWQFWICFNKYPLFRCLTWIFPFADMIENLQFLKNLFFINVSCNPMRILEQQKAQ